MLNSSIQTEATALLCTAQVTAAARSAELPIVSLDTTILDAVKAVATATQQLVFETSYLQKDVQRRGLGLGQGAAEDERLVWTQGLCQTVCVHQTRCTACCYCYC